MATVEAMIVGITYDAPPPGAADQRIVAVIDVKEWNAPIRERMWVENFGAHERWFSSYEEPREGTLRVPYADAQPYYESVRDCTPIHVPSSVFEASS